MSDTNKRAMAPQVLCDKCKAQMKIRTSLASSDWPGARELSYICEQCHATKIIQHRADPE
jgi:hypothetical protein